MNNLSDIFDCHKKSIVEFIDGVRSESYQKGRADTFEEIRDSMTFHQNGLSGYFTISLEEWEQLKEKK